MLILFLVLALVGAGLLAWDVRRSFPQTDGTISIPGLGAPVEVVRNACGIPDIYADNPQDLFTAMGYVVAQDRFWQMDVNRHITSGRLSEMFGESAVNEDAFLRTMGWREVAAQEFKLLQPETRGNLTSYAQGINAYLAGRSGADVSFEYSVLGLQNPDYKIEQWDPVDSIAWLKAMAFDLVANFNDEVSRVLTAAKVGIGRANQLYPPYPTERNGTIISDAMNKDLAKSERRAAQATAGAVMNSKPAEAAFRRAAAIQNRVAKWIGPQAGVDGIGSDSWVVSGDLTQSGKPLLSNDMHLGPQMPSIWYQAGLHCRQVTPECGYDVAGFVLPSVPGIVVGHNADIAWGFTNLGPDVSDLVLEQVEGDSYIVDGKRVPIATRTETLKVAGGDPIELPVRSTASGPIVSDIYGDSSKPFRKVGKDAPVPAPGQSIKTPHPDKGKAFAVALKWTALTPQPTMDAVPLINKAGDFDGFQKAAQMFTVPAQNMIYADKKGNIGYQAPGMIPIRHGYDGHWPVPGWDSRFRWSGYIPFAELPSIENPPAGWITTANQNVVPPDSRQAGVLTDVYSYGARAKRINIKLAEILNSGRKLTHQDMASTQMDAGNDLAAWMVPKLQQFHPGGFTDQAMQLLDGWDFQQPAGSAASMYFNAFYKALLDRMFTNLLGEDKATAFNAGDRFWEVIRVLWDSPGDPWWDDAATPEHEDRDQTVVGALNEAASRLSESQGTDPAKWTWGSVHTLTVENQTLGKSGIGPIERIFNRGPIETSGGGSIPLATHWQPADGYEVTVVPSMRQVVDLSSLDSSTWVNLTGNSGHAYNANYVDQLDAWNGGEQFPWPFSRPAVQQAGANTLTLQP